MARPSAAAGRPKGKGVSCWYEGFRASSRSTTSAIPYASTAIRILDDPLDQFPGMPSPRMATEMFIELVSETARLRALAGPGAVPAARTGGSIRHWGCRLLPCRLRLLRLTSRGRRLGAKRSPFAHDAARSTGLPDGPT